MKTELVANLSVNGQLILAEHSGAYQAPQEIAGMGISKALECGNLVVGKATYEMFLPIMKEVFDSLDVVVMSSSELPEVHTVQSAMDALKYLEGKGHDKVCVIGGTATYNAFLQNNLADELYFNIFPVVINGGGILEANLSKVLEYSLEAVTSNTDVVCCHYSKK